MSIRRGGLFLQYDENGQPCATVDDEPNGPYVLYADHAAEVENVWDEAYAAGFNHGRAHGELLACPLSYRHGLSAAREAVAASSDHYELCICDECCGTAAALAAIDALKEDK